MKYVTKTMMNQLLAQLRDLAPRRPLSYGESIQIARRQAAGVRSWVNSDKPDINLIWLLQQRAVPVNFVPSYRLGEDSGATTNEISGQLEIYVNEQEPAVRQRFTLLHEFKHVLDFADTARLYRRLGGGDKQRQALQIEAICNEFGAHVLMPTALVKHAWFQTQDATLCASVFNVSLEAINKRLTVLGLIGDPKPAPRIYFRRAGLWTNLEATDLPATA
jgi:hypothetical protein